MSPFPLPVVKMRGVSSAMSLKHLPAVLARSLYCPKRVVPSSGNLDSMATCPSGNRSGKLSKCALNSPTKIICWLSLSASKTSCCMCEIIWEISASEREEERGLTYVPPTMYHPHCTLRRKECTTHNVPPTMYVPPTHSNASSLVIIPVLLQRQAPLASFTAFSWICLLFLLLHYPHLLPSCPPSKYDVSWPGSCATLWNPVWCRSAFGPPLYHP